MTMKKTGDWKAATLLAMNLKKDLKAAQEMSLKRFAVKGEAIAIGHIENQDLNWEQLDPKYKAAKERQGYSDKIYVRTSTYFQNITSWVTDGKALVGVKRTVKNEDGESVANIAKILEYGSKARNLKARPLWRPSWKETRDIWYKNDTPMKIYIEKFASKYKKV